MLYFNRGDFLMFYAKKTIIIVFLSFLMAGPLWGEAIYHIASIETVKPGKPTTTLYCKDEPQDTKPFFDLFDEKKYPLYRNTSPREEQLREVWRNALRVDVFLPYYSAKEVESWVSEKTKMSFLKFDGKPDLSFERATYTFKMEF